MTLSKTDYSISATYEKQLLDPGNSELAALGEELRAEHLKLGTAHPMAWLVEMAHQESQLLEVHQTNRYCSPPYQHCR